MKRWLAGWLALSFCLFAAPKPGAKSGSPTQPKLVLVLVIDQFRADYLTRFQSRFLPAINQKGEVGGLRYLMEKGAWFPQGQYDLLQNMTGPGHSMILSGSLPYQSGIPVNNWFDRKKNEVVYCSEDAESELIGHGKKDPHLGTSPKNFRGTTVGDELKLTGYPSQVVSIALKDRAAIFMGGFQSDVTVWFDPEKNEWVSSKFYFPTGKLPDWVSQENQRLAKKTGQTMEWNVAAGMPTGFARTLPPGPFTKELVEGFGLAFPHTVKIGEKKAVNTPYGNEVTEEMAMRAIDALKLGQGKATDLLAVSFSTHDYLVHDFGPNSLEAEEITVADDRSLSRLLNYVAKKVPGGLKNVVITLTADHGIPSIPEYAQSVRIPAGRLDETKIADAVNDFLVDKFGKPKGDRWVLKMNEYNLFLNTSAYADKNVERSVVEKSIKNFILENYDQFSYVITSSDYEDRKLPPGLLGKQTMASYFLGRSGDVVLIARPFFLPGKHATTHLSGYSYDTTVPILFAGAKIKPGVYGSSAHVIDMAPTLSFLLGIIPPAMSEGRVLNEIIATP